MSVFLPPLDAGGLGMAYEGCRLGTNGRGGAGARGYRVKREAEDWLIGDLIFSAVSGVCCVLVDGF